MLRSDVNIIENFMRGPNGRRTMTHLPRGRFTYNNTTLTEPNGALLGKIIGLPVYRNTGLGNGIFQLLDHAGTMVKTNA